MSRARAITLKAGITIFVTGISEVCQIIRYVAESTFSRIDWGMNVQAPVSILCAINHFELMI